jgi:hypothetical protein
MSVEETQFLLQKNGVGKFTKRDEKDDYYNYADPDEPLPIYPQYRPIINPLIDIYSDELGELYFYKNRLCGRYVNIRYQYTTENASTILNSLKEKYPNGKLVHDSSGSTEFRYSSKGQIVYTLQPQQGYGGGGIYYFDPVPIKEIREIIKKKEIERKKEETNQIKNKI